MTSEFPQLFFPTCKPQQQKRHTSKVDSLACVPIFGLFGLIAKPSFYFVSEEVEYRFYLCCENSSCFGDVFAVGKPFVCHSYHTKTLNSISRVTYQCSSKSKKPRPKEKSLNRRGSFLLASPRHQFSESISESSFRCNSIAPTTFIAYNAMLS